MATHHHISIAKTGSVAIAAFAVTYVALQDPQYSMTITGALLGGLLPALFWLWFWFHEDKIHPEPKKIIFTAFFFGMIAVPLAIFLEKFYIGFRYPGISDTEALGMLAFIDLFAWAAIEEFLKFGMAFLAGLRSQYFDEPIDAVMYLISAALGFAAIENALFIWSAVSQGGFDALITGQLRFIGASLLHVAGSALIGFSIGFGLCKPKLTRAIYLVIGLVGAFTLHAVFNYLIIITNEQYLLDIFALLWIVMILIIFLFEKIKRSPCYKVSVPTLQ